VAQDVISTLGSWEGNDVSIDDVEEALSALSRYQQRAAVRSSVLTLICVVPDRSAAKRALDLVAELGVRHPARTVVVVNGDEDPGPPGIDAWAAVRIMKAGGGAGTCCEEIVLRVRGRRATISTQSSGRCRCPTCPSWCGLPSGSPRWETPCSR